jgi:hypothetical protein
MMKETLVSICSLLNKHEVDYLVIGGVAVSFHGLYNTLKRLRLICMMQRGSRDSPRVGYRKAIPSDETTAQQYEPR